MMPLSPECEHPGGYKCGACAGLALDEATDEIVDCTHACHAPIPRDPDVHAPPCAHPATEAQSVAQIIEVLPLPFSVEYLAEVTERLTADFGEELYLATVNGHVLVIGPGHDPTACWCSICETVVLNALSGWQSLTRRMCLCPDCGNKRCPRATDHRLACTGSNDPGQEGSVYE